MDPADLLAHLNEYLTEMTQVVMDEQGTLDKYIGDAIMAFWNAPRDVPDHADKALRTMILSQRKMGELNRRWAANDPDHEELVVRIGVNTGEVVVGNVGGENRFDYSAIGDAVNLAARLEPANKSYDTLNMCSQFTLDAADTNAFRIRELDLIAVKGKKKPVQVYEVLELTGVALPDAKEKAVAAYDLGMTAYKKHDWTSARDQFLAGLAACPDDGPCRVYAERCAAHLEDPPPADWDFVVRRMTK
jgi:adenylate cyclase